jgi:hypothetical protein
VRSKVIASRIEVRKPSSSFIVFVRYRVEYWRVAQLADSVSERRLDGSRCVKGSQHHDAFDGRESEFRRDVAGDTGQSEHLNAETLMRGTNRFQILSRKMLQPEHKRTAAHRFLDDLCVQRKLVAYSGSDQVSPIRIKAFLYEQIDLPKVDGAEVDRDFFRFAAFRATGA